MNLKDALTGKTYRHNTLVWENALQVISRVSHVPEHDFRAAVVVASATAAVPVMSACLFDMVDDISPFRGHAGRLKPQQTYRSMVAIAQFFIGRTAMDANARELIDLIGVENSYQFIADAYAWNSEDWASYRNLLELWQQDEFAKAGIAFGRRVAEAAGLHQEDIRWHTVLHSPATELYTSTFQKVL